MLLIPIGQEQSTVRRMPWVSYGIIALNFLVFVLAPLLATDRKAEIQEHGQGVLEYLANHPYLAVPPQLAPLLDDELLSDLEQAKAKYEQDGEVPGEAILELEQTQLERLTRDLLEVLRSGPIYELGFKPGDPRVVTLLTSMFMHAGWWHILGNMLFFFITGPFIEDLFGRAVFPILYLLSGLAATAAFAAHFPDSMIPLVGASGAIAGIMGAFLIRLGTARIRFLFLPLGLPLVRIPLLLPAFVVLPLWFGEQLWYAQNANQGSGVAWWAHVGGFLFGAVVAIVIKLTGAEERWIHGAIERQISIEQHPGLERAIDARAGGQVALAEQEIRAVLTAEPSNIDAWTEAYEIALARHDGPEAGARAGRLLDLLAKANEQGLAMDLIREVPERCPPPLSSRFCFSAASFFEKSGDGRAALSFYQRVINQEPADPAAFRAHFRQGEILRRSGDARQAREAYARALAHPACTEPWPQTIARAMASLSG